MKTKNLFFATLATFATGVVACAAAANAPILNLRATACEHEGIHYLERPSTTVSGSKEYWVCCDCHEHFLTEPSSGLWADSLKNENVFESTDDRYIAPVPQENEKLLVKGGAILDSNGDITFPESLTGADGIGNETEYAASVDYCAELKTKVYGGSFTMEFDVENYVVGEDVLFPKLMISLGGKFNNFYVVYNRTEGDNKISRIESFTNSVEHNKVSEGTWNSSQNFDDFNTAAKHHFKFVSSAGTYKWYVDNSTTPLTFMFNNQPVNIVPSLRNYYKELPIRIGTKGVSCKVSNLVVTNGNKSDLVELLTYGAQTTINDGAVTIHYDVQKPDGDSWKYRYSQDSHSNLFTTYDLANATGAYTLTFKAQSQGATNPSKICIMPTYDNDKEIEISFGEGKFQINNGDNISVSALGGNNSTVYVKLVKTNAGALTITVAGQSDFGDGVSKTIDGIGDAGIYLWSYNSKADFATKSITISEITLIK